MTKHAQNTPKLHLCTTTVVHKLNTADREARTNFVNWYVKGRHGATVILFSTETWYQLSGYVKSQNKSFPKSVHKVPIQDIIRFMCGVLWVQLVLLDYFCFTTIISHLYVTHSDTNFWTHVWLTFLQYNATAHTANKLYAFLNVFIIYHRLNFWPFGTECYIYV